MPGRFLPLRCLAGLVACATVASATGTERLPVTPFAVLPGDVRHPESLAVDPASGEVYVGQGLLWVAANQIDTLVALDERGRVRHRAGQFLGVTADGLPRGLLFPAASVVQGRRMIVANLALPLTPVAGDEWEEDVTRWNLMQFDLPDPPPSAP